MRHNPLIGHDAEPGAPFDGVRFRHRTRPAMMLFVLSLALLPLVACGGRGSALTVEPDTPLKSLSVAVLTHPEKAEAPETDENVHFAEYLEGLGDEVRPFASVALTNDRGAVDADIYISLNLDINYIKQVSRGAYLPKILTLWLWNLFGMPNSIASAHYHLSAVIYDRDANILNAFYVHEPVTFQWKNIYWNPRPEHPKNLRFVFNRLLAEIDRDMRYWQENERALGSYSAVVPAGVTTRDAADDAVDRAESEPDEANGEEVDETDSEADDSEVDETDSEAGERGGDEADSEVTE